MGLTAGLSRRIALLLVALALLAPCLGLPLHPAQAAPAEQSSVAMQARAGFGDEGYFLIGEWFPVHVILANASGGPSTRVRVEVDSVGGGGTFVGTYVREVDLPSPSRKEITLYLHGDTFISTVDVRLKQSPSGTQISHTSVRVSGLEEPVNTVVGVVSSDNALLNVLKGEHVGYNAGLFNGGYYAPQQQGSVVSGATVDVAHMVLEDIPTNASGLNSLSGLVIEDADTGTLAQEQIDAITAWVTSGGTLVLAPRPGGDTLAPGLASLLPVTLGATRSVTTLGGLSDLIAAPISPTSALSVYDATLRGDAPVLGRTLAAQDGTVLAAIRTLGEGQVAYLGVSPGLPPLRSWEGLAPLFQRLFAEHKMNSLSTSARAAAGFPGGQYSYRYPGGLFGSGGTMFDLPSLDLPDPWGITLFLLVYIILIGPVNFIILRRMRRTELAWATIPAFVIVFALGAYLIGYQAKGGETVLTRAGFSYLAPEVNTASSFQFWGLFSPQRNNFKVNLGSDSVVADLNSYGSQDAPAQVVGSAQGTVVDNLRVNTSSLRSFMAESSLKAEPLLASDLRLGDNEIVGTITNKTGRGLQDVALLRGDQTQYIGYLAAGQTGQVKLGLTSAPFSSSIAPTTILPAPAGTYYTGSGGGLGYSYANNGMSAEQRKYNRRVQLLNAALISLLSSDPATDMRVLVLAWDAETPVPLSLEGQSPSIDSTNLWVSRVPVLAPQAGSAHITNSGLPPARIYAPGNDMSVLSSIPNGYLQLKPYADFVYQLPAGTHPDNLAVVSDQPLPEGRELHAYNVRVGRWDNFTNSANATGAVSLQIPNPADYVGPAGDVTLRLQSTSGEAALVMSRFDLILNEK